MTQIALIDEGELEDVRACLDALGAEYVNWRKGDAPESPGVRRLLVTTPSYAVSLGYRRAPVRRLGGQRACWMAIGDGDTRSARRVIRESGFDTIVCRPVHPAALRALLRRALFCGAERRDRRRVIVGSEVAIRSSRRARAATLLDVGPTGCRLLAEQAPSVRARISIQFPKAIAGRDFWQRGLVLRAAQLSAVPETQELGVRFEPFADRDRAPMLQLLNAHRSGPSMLSAPLPSLAPASPPLDPSESSHPEREPRGVYEASVAIFGLENFSLEARDLSRSGLRVAPHRALTPGARLRLELLCEGGLPIVVDAEVKRLDGQRGTFMRFDWVDPEAQERLGSYVETLSPVWSGSPSLLDENDDTLPTLGDSLGRLVTRVLGRPN